jgi:hypothetical protein
MTCENPAEAVVVSLPISVVEAILGLRSALDDDVAAALGKSLPSARPMAAALPVPPSPRCNTLRRGKYRAAFLGVEFDADTLPTVFGRIVDMMAEVAPEALVSLAEICTGRRRFISRDRLRIHLSKPDLPVLQTASGWWISRNISEDQLKLACRKMCAVAGLTFGQDIKFPLR